jgi:hypothetical protein
MVAGVTDLALDVSDLVALIFAVKPSSDHEREIACRVDDLACEDRLSIRAIAGIAIVIPFTLSQAETRFLIDYIARRQDHAINQEISK